MTSLSMANMNTLFKKGYLLAGVVMAANMFVVNEMKAMDTKDDTQNNEKNNNENDNGDKENFIANVLDKASGYVLERENTFNLIGGSVFSIVNNYFKLWNYDAGIYCWEFGCFGWRSKRLLNGLLQFEGNLNAVRGIFWLIPGAYIFIRGVITQNDEKYFKYLHSSYLIGDLFKKDLINVIALIVSFLLQGFVSAPLTFHISKFSISISLDSIIFGIVGIFLRDLKVKKLVEEN